jgi:gp24
MFELNLNQTKEAILRCMDAGLVPLVSSQPGVGKSAIVKAIAEENELELIDLRLAQCEPSDLLGLPKVGEVKATYQPMSMFPLEGDEIPKGQKGWLLFLDELRNADTQVQNACYKLVLDRMIGTHHLHKECFIVCASNREEDASFVTPMPSALKSRLIHINTALDFGTWVNYAYEKGIDSRIIAFLQHRPNLLSSSHTDSSEESYACPRTWEFLSNLIREYDFAKISKEDAFVLKAIVAGTVGSGVATEFMAYTNYFNKLPKYEDIIKNPAKAKKVDTNDIGLVWALIGAIAAKVTEKDFKAVLEYLIPNPEDLADSKNISSDMFVVFRDMCKHKIDIFSKSKEMKSCNRWIDAIVDESLKYRGIY